MYFTWGPCKFFPMALIYQVDQVGGTLEVGLVRDGARGSSINSWDSWFIFNLRKNKHLLLHTELGMIGDNSTNRQ